MKRLIVILLFALASATFADWNTTIKVVGKLPPGADTFALRDSIETDVATSLNNAEVKFAIDHYRVTSDSSCWDVRIIINARTKEDTNIDTFGTVIYNYFRMQFGAGHGSIEVEYSKGVAF